MSRRAELSPQNSFREQGTAAPLIPEPPAAAPLISPRASTLRLPPTSAAPRSRAGLPSKRRAAQLALHTPYTHMSQLPTLSLQLPPSLAGVAFGTHTRASEPTPAQRAGSLLASAQAGHLTTHARPRPGLCSASLRRRVQTQPEASSLSQCPDRRPHLARSLSLSLSFSPLFPPCSGGA